MAIHAEAPRRTPTGCVLALLVAVLSVLAWSVAVTQTAMAGTVSVHVEQAIGSVRFVAGAGEANRVVITVSREPYGVVITDSGAAVVAGEFCTSLDAHTVRCHPPPESSLSPYPDVMLGDLDDEVSSGSGFGFRGYGGPGNDRLLGSPDGDTLDGGGGRDALYGGNGRDFLTDGDLDGMAGDGAPGPDILDGGPGPDSVTYGQRTVAVDIDTGDPGPDGALGEGDTVLNLEQITGGSGADRLAGDDGANTFQGGGGADRLIGRGGNDFFRGDFDPVAVRVTPDEGADSFACGPGEDLISPIEAVDFVEGSCETVASHDERFNKYFRPYPSRMRGTTVIFRLGCPFDFENVEDDLPTRCDGRLKITQATRRGRLLGRGELAPGRHNERSVAVRLTDTGKRLARRNQGVLAVIRVRGHNLGPAAWTIRLKLPR
jgi:hypothetical protein